MCASFFIIAFALLNIFWYVVFQVHLFLAKIPFLSDSLIMSPVLSCLDVLATTMAWIAALSAFATACAMDLFWLVCLLFCFV